MDPRSQISPLPGTIRKIGEASETGPPASFCRPIKKAPHRPSFKITSDSYLSMSQPGSSYEAGADLECLLDQEMKSLRAELPKERAHFGRR